MTVHIELLLVPHCPHAAATAELVATAVTDTGVHATFTQVTVSSEERARDRGFTGSPTILLDGRDPFASPGASIGLACRLYTTPDGLRGVPALRDLRQALEQCAPRQVVEPRRSPG